MRNFVIYSDYKVLLIVETILGSQRVVVMALISSLFLLSVFNSFSSVWPMSTSQNRLWLGIITFTLFQYSSKQKG